MQGMVSVRVVAVVVVKLCTGCEKVEFLGIVFNSKIKDLSKLIQCNTRMCTNLWLVHLTFGAVFKEHIFFV